jgi:hypothetical protein
MWRTVSASLTGPDPDALAGNAGTLAGMFALGAALIAALPRPRPGRPGRLLTVAVLAAAAGAAQAAALWSADAAPETYHEIRRRCEPTPAMIALARAAAVALHFGGPLLMLGAAWGAAARTLPVPGWRGPRPADAAGLLGATALGAGLVLLAADLTAGRIPPRTVGSASLLLMFAAALTAALRSDPAGDDAPSDPGPAPNRWWGWLTAGAVLIAAGAGLAAWLVADLRAAGEPAEWLRRRAADGHRVFAHLPLIVAVTAAARAAARLLLSRRWLGRLLTPAALAGSVAAVIAAGDPPPPAEPEPPADAPARRSLEAVLADLPAKTGRFLLVNWEPAARLPALPAVTGPYDPTVPLPQIERVGSDTAPGVAAEYFRITAGEVRRLALTPSDAMRAAPGVYDVVVIGPAPEGVPAAEWTSAEHFRRTRRLTRGLLFQVLRPGTRDDLAAALSALRSVYGQACGALLTRDGDVVLLAGEALPKPTRPDGPAELGPEVAGLLADPVGRWGGAWCRIAAGPR